MRAKLGKYFGERRTFQGVFKRFGSKSDYKGPVKTILIVNLVDFVTKKVLTDHIWFTCGKQFDRLDLREDDVVRFDARVTKYLKGYQGRNEFGEEGFQELDYRLSYPSNVTNVTEDMMELPSQGI